MDEPSFSRRQSLGLMATAASLSATATPLESPVSHPRVSVVDFGARGDGVADDSAAFQAALDTGSNVFVPAAARFYLLRRSLSTRRPGQAIVGEGLASYLVQQGEGSNATALVVQHANCSIAGLRIRPGLSTPLYEGWGVMISRASQCEVRQCWFEGLRRGGVLVHDATECAILNNRFVDGVVRADGSVPQSDMGYDVLIAGASSRNVVESNECCSGCGTGIGCQTVSAGSSQTGNVIRNNLVRGHPCYGVMIYLSAPDDRIDGVVVSGNSIGQISGSVKTDGTTYFYGAGIYIQTANDFLVEGNYLDHTNQDRRLPPSGSAVPAAIAISGQGNGVIQGNVIRNCIDGIASIQATRAIPQGEGTVITGNNITDCDRIGINLIDCTSATVVGNRLTGRGKAAQGIFLLQAHQQVRMSDFSIANNFVHRFRVGIAIAGNRVERAVVSGNIVTDVVESGIACGATTSIVTGNIVRGGGIALASTALHGWCRDNVMEVVGATGIDDRASGVTVLDNLLVPNAGHSAKTR